MMTKEQMDKILQLITIFFQENNQNRINRWLGLALINEVQHLLKTEEEKEETINGL